MIRNLRERINFWAEVSRAYSFPMSVMSWAIPFVFGICDGGSIFYGLLALFGILLVHAGTNMFDDFADFIIESRKVKNGLKDSLNFQKGKCRLIINGNITLKKLFFVIMSCFSLAVLCGINSDKPTAMDVYQGKTEIQVTSVHGVPIDSVVVFKEDY